MRFARTCSLLLIASVAVAPAAHAADAIDPFVGVYKGTASSTITSKVKIRDFTFEIRKHGNGFWLRWTTYIPGPKGTYKKTSAPVRFEPARRAGLYSAAMRRNAFGAPVPLDPLKGDPYMWANIRGKTLWVYGVHVTPDGGYEVQVYERTLVPGGMKVVFKRIRNGTPKRDISGFAKREK